MGTVYTKQPISIKDQITKLKQAISQYPSVDVAAMGFPSGWENEPLWR